MKHFAFAATVALFLTACGDVPTTSPGGANRVVQIGNTTGVTMTHFFASNTSRNSWEEDIFGSSVLTSGSAMNVDIDDGTGACMFDLMARFADGDEVVERNFNVCTESTWTVR